LKHQRPTKFLIGEIFLDLLIAISVLITVQPSAARARQIKPCSPAGRLSYVCGPISVEDMVQVPGTRWVIGSSMRIGKRAARGSSLYAIDTTGKIATPAHIAVGPPQKDFAGCPAPDFGALGTHGLELRPGPGGRHLLYTVNHNGRESIEVFQVQTMGGPPTLTWIGCLVLPPNTWGNAIAALPGGRLAISKFEDLDKLDMAPVLRGEITGTVYIWTPGTGFEELTAARLSGDNGLVATADGKWLYVNDQGRSQVVRLALDGSAPPAFAKVAFRPDNLRWAPDGTILVAGQVIAAGETLAPSHAWGVARLNPKTMAVTQVLMQKGRQEFSNATVALQIGQTLWIGTFRGDRIAYVSLR
jgi:hypothetical protein